MTKRYFIASGTLGIFIDAYRDLQLWTGGESGGAPGARTFATAEEAYAAIDSTPGMPADSSVLAIDCAATFCPLWEFRRIGLGGLLGNSLAIALDVMPVAGRA